MLIPKSRPPVRKLPEPIISGNWTQFSDPIPSPRQLSPLERNPQSPKGWKNRESDGVGLGIVAALEKSGGSDGPAKIVAGTPNLHVSTPVAIVSPRAAEQVPNWGCHGAKDSAESKWKEIGFFCESPPRVSREIHVFPTADFLSRCNLCGKRLHGKDIYMYRGEKAFCSMECRYQQIVSDEFQEKCGPEALRPSDVSSSPYTDGRLFSTGITVA